MAAKSLRDASRTDWVNEYYAKNENIQLGAILRIADASEKMAQNYTQLINRNEWLKGHCQRLDEQLEAMTRQRTALRGTVTRLKRQLAEAKEAR